jgi:excisionase family DNA binding protein
MPAKKFYTTGEAAELLNISRSTISRKFDRGVFFGKKNPITGERMISRESIAAFMKQYDLPVETLTIEKKRILLGTSDEHLFSLVQKAFSEDERIQLERVVFAGDVLVWCSKERPDLLIIDEDLSDIPCGEVIRSLRRVEEQRGLEVLCISKSRNTRRCLEWGADESVAKEGLVWSDLAKGVYDIFGLSEEPKEEIETFEHQRRWPRMACRFPAKIGIYPLRAPHRRDAGEAIVENISCGGAHLSQIRLTSGVIPCEPFRILVEVDQEPLKNWRTHCKVVRLHSNGSLDAGVQFTRLSRSNLSMIEALSQ